MKPKKVRNTLLSGKQNAKRKKHRKQIQKTKLAKGKEKNSLPSIFILYY